MKEFSVRQGDVFLEPVDRLPKNVKPLADRDWIALGEATGHAHRLKADLSNGAVLYEDDKGRIWVKVSAPTELEHEEHPTITLSPGVYKYTPQQEFDPWEEWRRVSD